MPGFAPAADALILVIVLSRFLMLLAAALKLADTCWGASEATVARKFAA